LAKTSGNAGVGTVGHALLTALRAPYVWASLVALALVLLGVGVPAPVDSMLNLIGEATSGVAIFVAGTVLAAYKVVLRVDTLVPTALKMIVETVALVLLLRLFGVSSVSARESIVLCALPTGVGGTMLATRYKVFVAETASTLLLTTVAMVVTVPFTILLVGS